MDEVIQEGVIAGIPAIEVWDWTFGEIMAQVRANEERRRRGGQFFASVAAGEAVMVASQFSKGTNPEIWEVFPFWTDEEVRELKVAKYRRIMGQYVAAGGGKRV